MTHPTSQPADQPDEAGLAPQREAIRDSMFLQALMRGVGCEATAIGRVRNLSSGGMMVEAALTPIRGDRYVVELRGVGAVDARVAWVADGRIGFAFDRPIDPRAARRPVGRR